MKKQEFKSIISECVKEFLNESDWGQTDSEIKKLDYQISQWFQYMTKEQKRKIELVNELRMVKI